jgi:hypothetical protein
MHSFLRLTVALLLSGHAVAQSSSGGAVYTAHTTMTASIPIMTGSIPPLRPTPIAAVPASAPAASAYVLNSSFVITNTPATRTYDWIVAAQTGAPGTRVLGCAPSVDTY